MLYISRKQFLQLGAALAGTAALAACGKAASGQSAAVTQREEDIAAANYTLADAASFAPAGALTVLRDDPFTEGFSSAEGFYRVVTRRDGSANICYTDYPSGQEIYLCSAPGCKHTDDTCTSWVPYTSSFIRPIPVGDALMVLYGGNPSYADTLGSDALARIVRMGPDGSDPKTMFVFSATCQLSGMPRGGFARDEENIYFVLNDEATGIRSLYAANSKNGQVYPLCDLAEQEEKIVGAVGQKLVLRFTPGAYIMENDVETLATSVALFDPATKETTVLFSYPFVDKGACSGEQYVTLSEAGTLRRYSLATGELLAEMNTTPAENISWEEATVLGVYDGKLVLASYQNEAVLVNELTHKTMLHAAYRACDIETGEMFVLDNMEWEWLEGVMVGCLIAADLGERYLCITGADQIEVLPAEDGTVLNANTDSYRYGFIDKADFWAGNGNFTPVTDARR